MRSLLLILCFAVPAVAQVPRVSFTPSDGQVGIHLDGQTIAAYVYSDSTIPRPFFAHIKTPAGIQVTRNHPPQKGDPDDHAAMHPGIWLAFGDLAGEDFWRNRASVKHVEFIQQPAADGNLGGFVSRNNYVRSDGTVVCEEELRFSIRAQQDDYLLELESTFGAIGKAFYFGDQEEMGLGVRVATGISEIDGGSLLDSNGRQGADAIWSHAADWCDYSGEIDGQSVGVTVMCHPGNFRESWFHARNYGLMVANLFGRAAMKKGQPSKMVVAPGDSCRLRYAIWVHGDSDADAIQKVYDGYVKSVR